MAEIWKTDLQKDKSISASGPTTKRGGGTVVKAGPLRKKNFFEPKKKVPMTTKLEEGGGGQGLSGRTTSLGTFFAASLTDVGLEFIFCKQKSEDDQGTSNYISRSTRWGSDR